MDKEGAPLAGREGRLPSALAKRFLAHPHRAKIMEILERNPGMNKHQLSKVLNVRINTVEFHVKRMVDKGFIELRPSTHGREFLCFRSEDVELWDDSATRVLFARGTRQDVAAYLVRNPGVEAQQIADGLDISIHKVRRHIRMLEEQNLVQRMRVERHVFYHAEPALQDWIQDVMSCRTCPPTDSRERLE